MRLQVSLGFCLLLVSSIMLHGDVVNAQLFSSSSSGSALSSILTGTNNPLEYFKFQPQELVEFLWSSLKPQYQPDVEKAFRNLQNFGNASQFLTDWAEKYFGKNMTNRMMQMSTDAPKLLQLFDREMLNLFQATDLQNANMTTILSRLMSFNSNAITSEIINQWLEQLQSSIPNITEKVNSTIHKLESDITIVPELEEEITNLGLPLSQLNSSLQELDQALRELVTKKLILDSGWANRPVLVKLRQILMRFNYAKFGNDLMRSTLRRLGDSLPKGEQVMLNNFIGNLTSGQTTGIKQLVEDLPDIYKYIRGMLMTRTNMTLPEQLDMDFQALELFGMYTAIEEGLAGAMTKIKANNESYAKWNNTAVPDMELLLMVVTSVDYRDIGQRIMGNVVDVITADKKIQPFVHQLVKEMVAKLNNSGTEQMINATTEYAVDALQQSLREEESKTNWTSLENSQKLAKVLMGVELGTFVRRVFVVVIKEHEANLSPELKQNITTFISSVDSQNKATMERQLTDHLETMLQEKMNKTIPIGLIPTRDAMIAEVTKQLISNYQLILAGNHTKAQPLLEASNTTFTGLTSPQKLAYLLVSLDYQTIGEVILESRANSLLLKLKNGESIVPDLLMVIDIAKLMLPLSDEQAKTLMNFANVVFSDINDQFAALYQNFSQNALWQSNNRNSTMKMADLVMAYNYRSTGDKVAWEGLGLADNLLSANVTRHLEEVIRRVSSGENVQDIFETMRQKVIDEYPMMSWLSKDALSPLFDMLTSHIQGSSQSDIDNWNAIPGKFQKLARFITGLNMTTLSNAMMMSVTRGYRNSMVQQMSLTLPSNISEPIAGFISILESGGLETAIKDMIKEAARNNTIILRVLNSGPVNDVIKSVIQSINSTYNDLKTSAGSEWGQLSLAEKFGRLFFELDVPMMVANLMETGQGSFDNMVTYYRNLFFPKYSQQCTWDLANITYAFSNIGKPETMWVMQLVDAWGKIPSGIMQGRFTWPGSIDECETIKGDSVNGATGEVIKRDGIKGAWSMAIITLPATLLSMAGLPPAWVENALMAPKLNWGMCLPASCDYTDIMKFTKKVEAFGANVPYIKPRSSYPAINGSYKTDGKFLGVSAFFVFLITIVTVSTIIDWAALRKCKEKQKRSATTEKIPLQHLPSAANGTVIYNGADNRVYYATGDVVASKSNGSVVYDGGEKVAHTNGGFTHDETMNGGVLYDGADKITNNNTVMMYDSDVEASSKMPIKQDKSKKVKEPGVGFRLMKAFSLYENLPRLMDFTPKPGQLKALDGIRFLSMTWVILGHSYSVLMGATYTQNMITAMKSGSNGDWTFAGIPAGVYAVDSFFLLSGLLVGYLFLKTLDKLKDRMTCGKFTLTMVLYYVHRYIRLLPMLGGVILIYMAYADYFGIGPMHNWHSDAYKNPCASNWWTNLLYINNVYNDKQMCLPWTWYLANDMQFYWISPLLLIPLHRVPKLGLTLIAAAFAAHLGASGWAWSKGNGGSMFMDFENFNSIYIKPYYRVGPYLVGLILGFMLYKKLRVRSRGVQAVCWLLSLGLIAACVYIPYDYMKEGGIMTNSWSSTERALFETLNKNVWAIALGWIIFASNTGCGGVIGDVLSWSGWAPLSKLTYAAYMIHIVLMEIMNRNMYSLVYITHLGNVFRNMGYLVASYLVGGVLHLLLEAPMAGIEKLILPRNK